VVLRKLWVRVVILFLSIFVDGRSKNWVHWTIIWHSRSSREGVFLDVWKWCSGFLHPGRLGHIEKSVVVSLLVSYFVGHYIMSVFTLYSVPNSRCYDSVMIFVSVCRWIGPSEEYERWGGHCWQIKEGKQKREKRNFYSFFNNVKDGGNVKSKKYWVERPLRQSEVSMSLPSQYVICISRYVGAVSGWISSLDSRSNTHVVLSSNTMTWLDARYTNASLRTNKCTCAGHLALSFI